MPIVQIQQVSFCECVNVLWLCSPNSQISCHFTSLSPESARERNCLFYCAASAARLCHAVCVWRAAHTQLKWKQGEPPPAPAAFTQIHTNVKRGIRRREFVELRLSFCLCALLVRLWRRTQMSAARCAAAGASCARVHPDPPAAHSRGRWALVRRQGRPRPAPVLKH